MEEDTDVTGFLRGRREAERSQLGVRSLTSTLLWQHKQKKHLKHSSEMRKELIPAKEWPTLAFVFFPYPSLSRTITFCVVLSLNAVFWLPSFQHPLLASCFRTSDTLNCGCHHSGIIQNAALYKIQARNCESKCPFFHLSLSAAHIPRCLISWFGGEKFSFSLRKRFVLGQNVVRCQNEDEGGIMS